MSEDAHYYHETRDGPLVECPGCPTCEPPTDLQARALDPHVQEVVQRAFAQEVHDLADRLLHAGKKLARLQEQNDKLRDRNKKQKRRLGELETAHKRTKDNLARVTGERDLLKAAIRRALVRPHPAAFLRLQQALDEVTGTQLRAKLREGE